MSISQYGEQIAVGQWRGKLTQHVYDSPEAMCHYERLEAQKAQARAQMPNPLERLSTAEIEEVTRAFVHQIARPNGRPHSGTRRTFSCTGTLSSLIRRPTAPRWSRP